MSRVNSSAGNVAHGMVNQGVQIVSQAVVRTAFAYTLGLEYIGLNAYLLSAVGVLALAELGAGIAFTYMLYAPLAAKDEQRVAKYVNWYARFYRAVALALLLLGTAISPIVIGALPSEIERAEVAAAYGLFLADLAVGYLLAHCRTLVIADQKERLVSGLASCVTVAKTLLQLGILLLTSSFLLFLIVQVLGTASLSLLIWRQVRRRYPYLQRYKGLLPSQSDKRELAKRLRAIFLYRVGSTAANSTDNIILGVVSGLEVVGGLANYRLILSSVDKPLGALHSALSASVGNLTASRAEDRSYFVFRVLFLINSWVSTALAVGFIVLSDFVIEVWLGEVFLVDSAIVLWMGINFFFRAYRRPVNTFKTAYGLFIRDRYRPLVEAIVNVGASLILVQVMGPVGVLVGTLVGYVSVNAWLEPLILYREGFRRPVREYYVLSAGVSFIGGVLLVVASVPPRLLTDSTSALEGFIVQVVVVLLLVTVPPWLLVSRSQEYREAVAIVRRVIGRRKGE